MPYVLFAARRYPAVRLPESTVRWRLRPEADPLSVHGHRLNDSDVSARTTIQVCNGTPLREIGRLRRKDR